MDHAVDSDALYYCEILDYVDPTAEPTAVVIHTALETIRSNARSELGDNVFLDNIVWWFVGTPHFSYVLRARAVKLKPIDL
jgi:hypothetical protein